MRLRLRIDRIVVDASLLGVGERERFERELRDALAAALPLQLGRGASPRARAVAQTRIDLGATRAAALAPAIGGALAPHVVAPDAPARSR
jgi:hypothetical protein